MKGDELKEEIESADRVTQITAAKPVLQKRLLQRFRVLAFYSKGQPCCECCGEDKLEFLAIDHVGGGGKKHREALGGNHRVAPWLEHNGYPNGFRVLCHNCNMAHGFYGYCPHHTGSKLQELVDRIAANPPNKGEKHWNSRLKVYQVKIIKQMIADKVPISKIASTFGVCKATISHIKCGRLWSSVE